MTPPAPAARSPADRCGLALDAWTAALAAGVLGFVWRYGPNMPVYDEWGLLPPLVGEAGLWGWLWTPHSEHLYPLPRLLWYALHQLSGRDFRAGMAASAVFAAVAAVLLTRVARRLRGRSHPADAVIPALLLHLGHWENWLLGYQVAFTLPVLLAAGVVSLLATPLGSPGRRLAAGVGCLALALCGGGGVLLAVPLAACSVGRPLVVRPRTTRSVLAAVPAVAALGYAGWYVAAAPPSAIPPPPTTPTAKAVTLLELAAGAVGFAGRDLWPWSGAVVAGAAVGLAALAGRRLAAGDARTVGPLAAAGGAAAVAGAIAVSRTGLLPQMGLSPRYALFTAFGACCLYAAARPAWAGAVGRAVGPLLAVVVVAWSVPGGLAYGHNFRHSYFRMRQQVRDGVGLDELAAEHVAVVYTGSDTPAHRAAMRDGLRVLERHRFGPYRPAR